MREKDDPVRRTLQDIEGEANYARAIAEWSMEDILRPIRRNTKFAVALAICLAIAMVVAAVTLFTHTFPSGTTGAHLTTTCSTLTIGTPSAPVGPGTVRFNCGASTAAFNADGGGPVTPTFSLLGTLYTGVSIVSSAAIGTPCSGGTALTSGTGITPAAGTYDYCASYTGSGGLGSFTLTWSQ